MAHLQWITPTGPLANLLNGVPASVEVLALDTETTSNTIKYSIISGSLPSGLTLNSNGVIDGTPITSQPTSYATTTDYSFIVRANALSTVSNTYSVLDGNFILELSNFVNNDFSWTTIGGDLGTIPNGQFYSLQLQAQTAHNLPVTYSLISGELPNGMELTAAGNLQGVPTFLESVAVDQSQTYRFTIRATSSIGHVLDQSFSLTLTNVYGAVIEPATTNLGTFFDGSRYTQQLTVVELNPNAVVLWSIKEGSLPPGLTLSPTTGLISGYIQPVQLIGPYGPAGYDGNNSNNVGATATLSNCIIAKNTLTIGSASGAIYLQMVLSGPGVVPGTQIVGKVNNNVWTVTPLQNLNTPTTLTGTVYNTMTQQEYDYGPYDFTQLNQSVGYSFTVQAFDGANYDTQNYFINVVARSGFTADSSLDTVDDTFLTIDTLNVTPPVLLNTITSLPQGRQQSYYAYQFVGTDFSGNVGLNYSIVDTAGTFDAYIPIYDIGFDNLPFDSYTSGNVSSNIGLPGLTLDSSTGWLYGHVNSQVEALQQFNIAIIVSKTVNTASNISGTITYSNVTYSSTPKFFTLPILGDVNNIITWSTPSDLGTIDNGSVSDVSIVAVSPIGKPLVYRIVDSPGVPARLPQGLELLPSGDISGRVAFETFDLDNYTTTFDGSATTIDKQYTFTVLAETTDGTASAMKTFTVKLNVIDQNPYVNVYLKAMPAFDQRQIFNSVVSNTEIFVPELIYRPLDPWFGVNTEMNMLFLPGLNSANLTVFEETVVKNHWTKKYDFGSIKTAVVLDSNYNIKYEVVYVEVTDPELNANGQGPGLEINLEGKIANPYISSTGQELYTVYPNTSTNMVDRLVESLGYYDQSSLPPWMTSNQSGTTTSTFSPPLGYTRAVVLAYTKPGASKLIAYRLNNAGINFNNIEFTVDRYQIDNYYSEYFVANAWVGGAESTFDALSYTNVGSISAVINYAVTVPYSSINGHPVSAIQAAGGLDGIVDFVDGQTLIFAKQENFSNSGPYDGWVNYYDGYIGDNINTYQVEGYDSEGYDSYTLVPGYLDSLQAGVNLTGDGSTVSFRLPVVPNRAPTVFVNGLIQPSSIYNIVGDVITFITPPPSPTPIKNIQIYHADNNEDSFTGDGSTTAFTMSEITYLPTAITVLINGVVQLSTSYSVAGTTINFHTAPPSPVVTPNIQVKFSQNKRAGIWKINITDGNVTLEFVKEIEVNQRVQVIGGKTYNGAILYYDPILVVGQTVPAYSVYKVSINNIKHATTFNNGSTKFFTNRDKYYAPNTNDQYVKFPQVNAFQ